MVNYARGLLLAFDNAIIASMKTNQKIAPYTYKVEKSDLQYAACQIIPQGISIALSIRELVRQGYLFGALVLMRSLLERATTILYLHHNPDKIKLWNDGWRYNERPSLSEMLTAIGKDKFPNIGSTITPTYNSLTHGDPESAFWNLIRTEDGNVGYGVSKIIDNPSLCDKICLEGSTWLLVLISTAAGIFPNLDEYDNICIKKIESMNNDCQIFFNAWYDFLISWPKFLKSKMRTI